MSLLDIHVLGSPILRHETTPITDVTDEMPTIFFPGEKNYDIALKVDVRPQLLQYTPRPLSDVRIAPGIERIVVGL